MRKLVSTTMGLATQVCVGAAGTLIGAGMAAYWKYSSTKADECETDAPTSETDTPTLPLRLRGAGSATPWVIDLGFMKIPMEGPLNHAKLLFGVAFGCAAVTVAFSATTVKGAALQAGAGLLDACRGALLANSAWCVVYYNLIGVSLLCKFSNAAWQLFSDKDTTAAFDTIASRFAGNMMEHSVMFLSSLWMYTLFADSATGGTLGMLYVATRLAYPLFYIFNHGFDFWFEMCTQTGYGITGVFLLGTVYTALGGDWVAFASAKPVLAGVYGFLFGSFILVPGIPTAIPYAILHYKVDNSIKKKKN